MQLTCPLALTVLLLVLPQLLTTSLPSHPLPPPPAPPFFSSHSNCNRGGRPTGFLAVVLCSPGYCCLKCIMWFKYAFRIHKQVTDTCMYGCIIICTRKRGVKIMKLFRNHYFSRVGGVLIRLFTAADPDYTMCHALRSVGRYIIEGQVQG